VQKLIRQLAKFGIVGIIAFIIDFGGMNLLLLFNFNNLAASTISFLVSLVFNYCASMKYVFTHRDDMALWMEVVIFFLSAAIGLVINEIIIWTSTSMLPNNAVETMHSRYVIYTNAAKVLSALIVSAWNFAIRKWLLDAPEDGKTLPTSSFAHRLGQFSLTHHPFNWK
jgi:putative flippase GtrA